MTPGLHLSTGVDAPIVSLSGVSAGYGDAPVISGIDFEVRPGEVVAVLGANGSGKSTLVKTILRSTTVTAGALELFGTPAGEFRDWHRVGYVPQRLSIGGGIPATVREVVTTGRLARRRWFRPMTTADRHAVDRAIELVDLRDKAGARMSTLSGGQQRRVLIARALAGEPDVLVMDEPMAGVDAASQLLLAGTLASLIDLGATIVLVAHELGPIGPLVTRVVDMGAGQITCDGPIADHAGHAPHDDFDPHPHPHEGDSHGEQPRSSGLGLLS
ncbi:MAG: metal ABC transporter ATP-binding protein [Mycobacteriales bacterium]